MGVDELRLTAQLLAHYLGTFAWQAIMAFLGFDPT
jgi:hypothetical protein